MLMRAVGDVPLFEAEILVGHSSGPIAFKRRDSGECIPLWQVLGVPGSPSQEYQVVEVSYDEIIVLNAHGVLIR